MLMVGLQATAYSDMGPGAPYLLQHNFVGNRISLLLTTIVSAWDDLSGVWLLSPFSLSL